MPSWIQVWAVIIVQQLDALRGQFSYSIRMNQTTVPNTNTKVWAGLHSAQMLHPCAPETQGFLFWNLLGLSGVVEPVDDLRAKLPPPILLRVLF